VIIRVYSTVGGVFMYLPGQPRGLIVISIIRLEPFIILLIVSSRLLAISSARWDPVTTSYTPPDHFSCLFLSWRQCNSSSMGG